MKKNSLRVRTARGIYLLLAVLFALCVTVQVFIAGMAVFDDPVHWMNHMMFVHMFGFNLPIIMLIFAFVGSMPRWVYWQLFGILVSVFLMYFTANIGIDGINALHTVFAILLSMLSVWIVVKNFKLVFGNEKEEML
ncbi:DUF6220 domain-containing protein [Salinicoccus bachuensis]|uniref:DUF6220 domain-containing protein n=1 Tax=Salinicoccus bachuensis TaxID=3136731 RepID=A0ABZ3CLH2_9STAP